MVLIPEIPASGRSQRKHCYVTAHVLQEDFNEAIIRRSRFVPAQDGWAIIADSELSRYKDGTRSTRDLVFLRGSYGTCRSDRCPLSSFVCNSLTPFHGGSTDSELAVAQRFSRWLPSHPRGLTVWPLHVPVVRAVQLWVCLLVLGIIGGVARPEEYAPNCLVQIFTNKRQQPSRLDTGVHTSPAQRFTPRASCTETVSKAVRFGPLDLCLSERQIPQVIVFIRRDRNQQRLRSGRVCAQGRCATRLRYAPTG